MSLALEIVHDDGTSIDLDRWCHFAVVEGKKLIGTLQFGTPIISDDTDDIVEKKKKTQADECDKFLDTIEPFINSTVSVIYNATRTAEVFIPEDGGIADGGKLLLWKIATKSPIGEENYAYDAPEPEFENDNVAEQLFAVNTELLEAVKELTSLIKTKRGK